MLYTIRVTFDDCHLVMLLCLCVDKLYMGPGQLYQDLQNLIHDLNLVNQISGMISSLKGNYQVAVS